MLLPASAGSWAQDAPVPVDLELVLAVDVSGSIDPEEARLQRNGYFAALADPEVIGAIRSGLLQRIAVTYVEWAGASHQRTVVGWTEIGDEAEARDFAARIAAAPVPTESLTSISGAIDYALPQFGRNGFEGTRKVIDISGDGPNNIGLPVVEARDRAVAAGVTINGLPIVNDRMSPGGWPPLPDLDLYYAHCVVGGAGAFIIVAENFETFAAAIRRKLLLEIAGLSPFAPETASTRLWRAAAGGTSPGSQRQPPPCDIGERRFREMIEDNYP